MAASLLSCPICSQPGFSSVDSLRHGLISAATRQLVCPVCQDVLLGLDKFTIHLFSHSLQHFPSDNVPKCSQRIDHTLHCVPSNSQNKDHVVKCSQSRDNLLHCVPSSSHGKDQVHYNLVSKCPQNKDTVSLSAGNNSKSKDVSVCVGNSSNCSRSKDVVSSCKDEVPAKEDVSCEVCRLSFPDATILEIHRQLVHQGPRHFPCVVCRKLFKMRGSLMVHMRVAHGGINAGQPTEPVAEAEQQTEVRSFPCSTCGKAFKKEQHLSQHIKTHEGKQWECDVCSKMFTTKYFLKKHKRLHTGEMPYSCGTCHKTFTFQQSYHKHLLYHSDDKPHVCGECDRAFKELSTLHNHQRIHTGEKPFACETCGKCFRQRVSYLVHRRIHTGVMPYKCTACGKSFRYKVSQRTHKCPSQPPGTVVRQSGELVQKLLQRTTEQQQAQATVTESPVQPLIIFVDGTVAPSLLVMPAQPPPAPPPPPPPETETKPHEEEPPPPVFQTPDISAASSTDFFSMVMSPSEGLRHLSLSPSEPTTKQSDEEGLYHFLDPPDRPEPLETINEESLKQLLYGPSL